MAVEVTPLGFKKPDGNELVRQGDNVISDNAQRAQDLHHEAKLATVESKARIATLESVAGFTGDPLDLNDSAVAEAFTAGAESQAALNTLLEDTVPVVAAATLTDTTKVMGMVKPFGTKAFARKSPTGYEVGYQIDERRAMVHTYETYASAPGGYNNLYQLVTGYVRRILGIWDHTEPSIVLAGGGWTNTVNGSAYGGAYTRSTTTGASATWKSPAGMDRVSIITGRSSSVGGYSKVVITDDLGQPIDAASLPTAQDEVTAGRLDSTSLVANGGTLNPTDRVLDNYGTGSYSPMEVQICTTLDAERAHTIVATATGYKQAAATDARLVLDAFAGLGPYTMRNPQRAWTFSTDATIGPSASISAHEYAISTRINGNLTTIGNVHGYDNQTSFTIKVDGTDITSQLVTTSDIRAGANVEVTRVSELFHPGAVGKVADVTVKYVFTPGHGMTVSHTITWAVAGSCTFHYPVMFPLGATRKASFAGKNVDYTLTANDLSRHPGGKSPLFYAWTISGDYAVTCQVNPKSVKNWENAPTQQMQVEDRNSIMIKLYVPMVLGPDPEYAWSVGEVWNSEALYRVARVPGANGSLARV